MLEISQESTGELQKAQFERAKNIINKADTILSQEKSQPIKVDVPTQTVNKVTLEEALDNLNSLVGLNKVKKQVADWVDQIKVFKMREERGMKLPSMSYHLVFTGNPGTGKTTVARIMSQIYCALGVISNGHLVEVDRSELVAGYVGQTAIKTMEIIKKAIEARRLSYSPYSNFAVGAVLLTKDGKLFYIPFLYKRFENNNQFIQEDIKYWFYTAKLENYLLSRGFDFDHKKLKSDYEINKFMALVTIKYYR